MYGYKKDGKYYLVCDKCYEVTRLMFHQFIFSNCVSTPDGDDWEYVVDVYRGRCGVRDVPLFYGDAPEGMDEDAFSLDDDDRELVIFFREDPVEYIYVSDYVGKNLWDVIPDVHVRGIYLNGLEKSENCVLRKCDYFITVFCDYDVTVKAHGRVYEYREKDKREYLGRLIDCDEDGIRLFYNLVGLCSGVSHGSIASRSCSDHWRENGRVYFYADDVGIREQLSDVVEHDPAGSLLVD